ncbi:hypothetical protein MESS2_10042 [Mesorhizobium metallidurans STM 2683]|uniref:Uncharacterized protein n=1 Tax=Mesorhizobium metallidurans STM 2683 TaxID=1297569 RepID=M5ETF8_9HYPH|nr:hypothetical protein MESS2_10042 [Mesorhizobium metallidurans STM 2683]
MGRQPIQECAPDRFGLPANRSAILSLEQSGERLDASVAAGKLNSALSPYGRPLLNQ